jgi:hypothetical protein
MIIELGEWCDIGIEEGKDSFHHAWVVLVVYGHETVAVTCGSVEGETLKPFLDETGYENMARAWFHLKPFGVRIDPFGADDESEGEGDEREFQFHVRYCKEDGDVERTATVTLTAICGYESVVWSVRVTIEGVDFSAGELPLLDRDVRFGALLDAFKTVGGRPPRSHADLDGDAP